MAIALVTCVGAGLAGCSDSRPPRKAEVAKVQQAPTPPTTQDAVAFYNDAASTVYVDGCAGCGASGKAVAPGAWLPLNLPPNKIQLRIQQSTGTTCLMIVNGVDTGKPLVVKESDSAASAC
jgi:hypothetical protein